MLQHDWRLNIGRSGPQWTWFDPKYYARHDALAAAAARLGDEEALADFNERGARLNLPPNLFFDPVFYLNAYPDVTASVTDGTCPSAWEHYRTVGWHDRTPHWLFDAARYLTFPDLDVDTLAPLGGPYGHYLTSGASEGRPVHPMFDPKHYAAEVSRNGCPLNGANPFAAFLRELDAAVDREPSGSPYFDAVWYMATYGDVGRSVRAGAFKSALHHYVLVGASQSYDPLCDFSEQFYREHNPDVVQAIEAGYFKSGYEHFLRFGAADQRQPCSYIDLAWYAAQPVVSRQLAIGGYATPFEHLLKTGLALGLPTQPLEPADFAPDEAGARSAFLAQARRALPALGRRPLDFRYVGQPDVSVIMVLRNQFALTMQSLASLRHTYPGAIQLLVVDNASIDGTERIGELAYGIELFVLQENIGFLRACNMALDHARAPAVLYLNNDVVLHPEAIQVALDRLGADPTLGAVGGKIIRTHGLLQEAGCFVWRDGSADGWMRDAPPDAPEASHQRDVDYCSGAFLMVRGDLLRQLGGFDDAFAPAYYEEVDLCLRIAEAGFRVLYDPAIVLTHFEYGSSRSLRAASALMLANRSLLRERHAATLRSRPNDRRHFAEMAGLASRGRRVLFLEDTIPLQRFGSGYGRSADVLCTIAELGWKATVFPMHPVRSALHEITAAMPDTIELLWDRDHRSLKQFLSDRAGYYDLVWISRAHNLRQLLAAVGPSLPGLERAKLVLDTESVFSLRDASRAALDGVPFDLKRALAMELENAWLCHHIVAVNEAEAQVLREASVSPVSVVGFLQTRAPTPQPWSERRGLLHVGALTTPDSPNCDGLRWFLDHVHPLLEVRVGPEQAKLTVAGFVAPDCDLSWLKQHPGVVFVGAVGAPEPFYDTSRVFIAPTRFAAGVPTKVLDAAAHGLPVVCTDLLLGQLGWTDGLEARSAAVSDAAGFADQVAALLCEQEIWDRQRDAALASLQARFGGEQFARSIAAISNTLFPAVSWAAATEETVVQHQGIRHRP